MAKYKDSRGRAIIPLRSRRDPQGRVVITAVYHDWSNRHGTEFELSPDSIRADEHGRLVLDWLIRQAGQ